MEAKGLMSTVRNTGLAAKMPAASWDPREFPQLETAALSAGQEGPIAAMEGLTIANLARLHLNISEMEATVSPALRPDDTATEAPGLERDRPPFRSMLALFLFELNGQLEHAVRRLEDIRRRSEF